MFVANLHMHRAQSTPRSKHVNLNAQLCFPYTVPILQLFGTISPAVSVGVEVSGTVSPTRLVSNGQFNAGM